MAPIDPPQPATLLTAPARRARCSALAAYGWLWLLAFTLRGVYLWELSDSPLWSTLMGDAEAYDAWGRRIAGGEWLGHGVFYQAPLYPYFLGVIYRTIGHSLAAVRMIQIALGATSCVLVAIAGRRFFSQRAGLAAGGLLALYPPAIFFDGLIQKTVLDAFFLCLLLALLGALSRRPERRTMWLAAGAALGALILTRENALLLVPIVMLWSLKRAGSQRRGLRGSAAGLVAAGVLAVLLPVAARNRAVGGEWHLTTSQFGPNFYIGNHHEADGLYVPLRPGRGSPRYERTDATSIAERDARRPLTPREVSRYWTRRAWAEIAEAPWSWGTLLVQKWFLTWHVVEQGDFEDLYTHAEESRLLAALLSVLNLATLGAAAALGVVATFQLRRKLWILYALLLTYAASVALFYVFARYRYPLVPILSLFAGGGLCQAIPLARRAPRALAAGAAAAVVAALTILGLALPSLFPRWPDVSTDRIRANTHLNLALHLEAQAAETDVLAQFDLARRLDPDNVEPLAEQGRYLRERGRGAEGLALLREAVRLDPEATAPRVLLAEALAAEGQTEDALSHVRWAVAQDPADLDAVAALGRVLVGARLEREALAVVEDATHTHGRDASLLHVLGVIQLQQRNDDAALETLTEAVAREPGLADARVLLGLALHRTGRVEEALEQWEIALPRMPVGVPRTRRLERAIDEARREGARRRAASQADVR